MHDIRASGISGDGGVQRMRHVGSREGQILRVRPGIRA